MDEFYQVEGVSGDMWGVEQEFYATLKEARRWAQSQRSLSPRRIVKVSRNVVEEIGPFGSIMRSRA